MLNPRPAAACTLDLAVQPVDPTATHAMIGDSAAARSCDDGLCGAVATCARHTCPHHVSDGISMYGQVAGSKVKAQEETEWKISLETSGTAVRPSLLSASAALMLLPALSVLHPLARYTARLSSQPTCATKRSSLWPVSRLSRLFQAVRLSPLQCRTNRLSSPVHFCEPVTR